MDFKLQLGAQRSHPQELTQVSDWGMTNLPGADLNAARSGPLGRGPPRNYVQVTTLQFERRRVYKKDC
ncbi:hypothetical protein MC48_010670 [Serratia marcescens]|nr:hypothetical protein MC48_010670 [Serratia marcescens]